MPQSILFENCNAWSILYHGTAKKDIREQYRFRVLQEKTAANPGRTVSSLFLCMLCRSGTSVLASDTHGMFRFWSFELVRGKLPGEQALEHPGACTFRTADCEIHPDSLLFASGFQKQYYMILLSFILPVATMGFSYIRASMALYASVKELQRMTGADGRSVQCQNRKAYIHNIHKHS